MIKTYSELRRLDTFESRYTFLRLGGRVGRDTFGYDRPLNQQFYKSSEWRSARDFVIARDNGCDLGIEGYEIHSRLLIHHMNPLTIHDVVHGTANMFDPEFLVTTTHRTHNAIHYGDASLLPKPPTERTRGDTLLWGKRE